MDDTDSSAPQAAPESTTERIIERFGGIRPMATKLDTPVTTVQGWKKRGVIPVRRHADILAAAARATIEIDPAELAATDPGGGASRFETRPDEVGPAAAAPRLSEVSSQGGSLSGLALTISVIALLATTGVAGGGWWFYVRPLQSEVANLGKRLAAAEPAGDLNRRIAVLEADIARFPVGVAITGGSSNGDLAELSQDVARLKAASSQTEQLAKRMGELQLAAGGRELLSQSIQDIQSSTAATQGEVERLNGMIKSMTGRLDQVDAVLSQRRQQALRAEALILAVGQLRAALRQSKPFTGEVRALRALAGDDPQIAALMDKVAPVADSGVPTPDDLRTDLDHLAPEIVRSAVVGDGSSWWRQALYRVESVVTIRRVGTQVAGDKVDAIVARAGAKADGDDLAGALAELQGLTGLTADAAAPWIRDTGQRLLVDGVETDLTRLSIDRVAADRAQATVAPAAATPVSPNPNSERPQ